MRHYEEPVVALCRTCNRPFCSRCLVFSFGPNKPPFCVGCALSASGVRNNSKTIVAAPDETPVVDRRMERSQRRAEKSQAKAEMKALKRAGKSGAEPESLEALPRSSNIPVPKGLTTPSSRFASPNAEHAAH